MTNEFDVKIASEELYFKFEIYETKEIMHKALEKYSMSKSTEFDVVGVFSPQSSFRCSDNSIFERSNNCIGKIFISQPFFQAEVITHELIHAVLEIYRQKLSAGKIKDVDANFEKECGEKEEYFALLYGRFFYELNKKINLLEIEKVEEKKE